eukprot:1454380-Ditylum_brightwellii.AAC.1
MHFGKQSGAVSLAVAVISMPNLKRAGRLALILVVEQYMEYIHASKTKRVTLLNKKEKQMATPKKKAENIETSNEDK